MQSISSHISRLEFIFIEGVDEFAILTMFSFSLEQNHWLEYIDRSAVGIRGHRRDIGQKSLSVEIAKILHFTSRA
jgi:hypothetical protein